MESRWEDPVERPGGYTSTGPSFFSDALATLLYASRRLSIMA